MKKITLEMQKEIIAKIQNRIKEINSIADADESSKEHIASHIKDGYNQGEYFEIYNDNIDDVYFSYELSGWWDMESARVRIDINNSLEDVIIDDVNFDDEVDIEK